MFFLERLGYRSKRFCWYFVASGSVVVMSAVIVFGVWYPAPLDISLGAGRVFVLVLLGLLVGPFLMLLTVDPARSGWRRDAALITLIQLAAFGYGISALYTGRPAWIVFSADRFDVVRAVDIDTRELAVANVAHRRPSSTGPVWVGALESGEAAERELNLFEAVFAGVDIYHKPKYYVPLSDVEGQMSERAFPLNRLNELNDPVRVAHALSSYPEAEYWLPLMARQRPMVVLLDDKAKNVLGVVDLSPYPEAE